MRRKTKLKLGLKPGSIPNSWRATVRLVPPDNATVYQVVALMAKMRARGARAHVNLDGVELDELQLEQRWRDVVLRETTSAMQKALGGVPTYAVVRRKIARKYVAPRASRRGREKRAT